MVVLTHIVCRTCATRDDERPHETLTKSGALRALFHAAHANHDVRELVVG